MIALALGLLHLFGPVKDARLPVLGARRVLDRLRAEVLRGPRPVAAAGRDRVAGAHGRLPALEQAGLGLPLLREEVREPQVRRLGSAEGEEDETQARHLGSA